jgi:lipopolysaccharide export system protein LptC
MTGTAFSPAPRPTEAAIQAGGAPRPRPGGPRAGGSYTRFVSLMKVALPMAAGVLVLLVVTWPQIEKRSEGFRLGATGIAVEDSKGQRIVNARFNGVDENGRPYTVTADGARQAEAESDNVELQFPKADITLNAESWIALSAETGTYRKQSELLDLAGNVTGFHDQGYEFNTSRARVDLARGTASGDAPVAGHGPLGEMKGEGFRLSERGTRILFTGKSKLTIFPSAKKQDAR